MVSAAILAGGLARRFGGADKSALLVGGRPILDRLLAVLHEVSDDVMIVGRPVEAARVAHTAPVRAVPDRQPGRGPLGGLDAALAAARHDLVAVVACDMPCVSTGLLRVLLDHAAHLDPGTPAAVVPHSDRGYHPLCAVYTRACGPVVARHLGLQQLRMIDVLGAIALRVPSRAELGRAGDLDTLLANVNTPGERDGIERLLSHEL